MFLSVVRLGKVCCFSFALRLSLPTPSGVRAACTFGWLVWALNSKRGLGSCMSQNQLTHISSGRAGLGQVVHSGSGVFWPLVPSGVRLVCKIVGKAGRL